MSFKKEIRKLDREFKQFEKGLAKEIIYVEKWMIARKKFFVKLIWVVGLIVALLILLNFI